MPHDFESIVYNNHSQGYFTIIYALPTRDEALSKKTWHVTILTRRPSSNNPSAHELSTARKAYHGQSRVGILLPDSGRQVISGLVLRNARRVLERTPIRPHEPNTVQVQSKYQSWRCFYIGPPAQTKFYTWFPLTNLHHCYGNVPHCLLDLGTLCLRFPWRVIHRAQERKGMRSRACARYSHFPTWRHDHEMVNLRTSGTLLRHE